MKPEMTRLAALCAVIDQDLRAVERWHAYDFELDAEKLGRLVRDWRSARPALREALTHFRNLLLSQVEQAD